MAAVGDRIGYWVVVGECRVSNGGCEAKGLFVVCRCCGRGYGFTTRDGNCPTDAWSVGGPLTPPAAASRVGDVDTLILQNHRASQAASRGPAQCRVSTHGGPPWGRHGR